MLRTLSAKTFLIYLFFLVVLRPTLPFRTVVSLVEDSSKLRDVFFLFKKITIKSLGSMSIRKVFDEECLHFSSSSSKNWIFFSAPHQFGLGNKPEMTKIIKLLYPFCRKVLKGKKIRRWIFSPAAYQKSFVFIRKICVFCVLRYKKY